MSKGHEQKGNKQNKRKENSSTFINSHLKIKYKLKPYVFVFNIVYKTKN